MFARARALHVRVGDRVEVCMFDTDGRREWRNYYEAHVVSVTPSLRVRYSTDIEEVVSTDTLYWPPVACEAAPLETNVQVLTHDARYGRSWSLGRVLAVKQALSLVQLVMYPDETARWERPSHVRPQCAVVTVA